MITLFYKYELYGYKNKFYLIVEMGQEIERKFLINKEKWESIQKPNGEIVRQGYLLTDPKKTIRVRQTDRKATLTIKGLSVVATRSEFEYEIPKEDAEQLFHEFSIATLTKIRYKILFRDKIWEIDEFQGENKGLIIAEIELISEDELFSIPEWIEKEVTGDKRYYNSYLSEHPFLKW